MYSLVQHPTQAFNGDRRHTQPLVAAYLWKPTPEELAYPSKSKKSSKKDDLASVQSYDSQSSTISLLKKKLRRSKSSKKE
jgi:hypothetical protein